MIVGGACFVVLGLLEADVVEAAIGGVVGVAGAGIWRAATGDRLIQ
jgi:hypothetical protein